MADKKISELDSALQINDDAAFPFSQLNGGQQTTFKAVITALAVKIAEGITFSNLLTEAKTLVGAINEVSQGGGAAILIGTSDPSSSQGSNGNLYIQYTEGTGGADDTVDALYVKLDGAWCEISTGGGTGSTTLAGLTDVSLSSPADKEVLEYDGTAQKWKNKSTSIEKTIQNVAIASFTDGADNVPLSELEVEIEPNLSGVSSVNVVVNGKNFLPMTVSAIKSANTGGTWSGNIYSRNSLTFEVLTNSDNLVVGIKVNGTASASTLFELAPQQILYGSFAVNGCPSGGANNSYRLDIRDYSSSGVLLTDIGNGITGNIYNKNIYGCIRIEGGAPVNNLTFYPMLRLATETDASFEPYNGTTYPISLGETLTQGGSLNVKTGLLTRTDTTTSQLSGMPDIRTLIGNNNIFADSGDIEKLTYFNINADELADLISVYSNLNALSDVDISNPTNNQVLVYNATTKKWENGTIASGGGHNYSTSEQIVGEWIDGSTIYEQTIYVDSFPNNTSKNLTTPANIDLLIDSFGFMKNKTQTGYMRTLPFAAGGTNDVRIDLNGGTLRAVTFSDWSGYDGYLTIRYTKSST